MQLYGWSASRLPEWFTERFPAEYHRKRLFDEQPDALLHVGSFEKRNWRVCIFPACSPAIGGALFSSPAIVRGSCRQTRSTTT